MIELRDISIQVGAFSLSNISFEIRDGEYCILMGKTGSGKTTILESISGLRQLTEGRVFVRRHDVTDWSPADREIGYVPQDLALFPTMSVREHLEFSLRLRKRSAKAISARLEELVELLQLGSLLDRLPEKLSGGESQRVALGRALSFEPSVLLLDEPFSALDESTRSEMHVLLHAVTHAAGVTTLHVTHSSEEAQALATRRLILRDGCIVDESASDSNCEHATVGGA